VLPSLKDSRDRTWPLVLVRDATAAQGTVLAAIRVSWPPGAAVWLDA
jgi:hypothetical protein